MTTSQAAIDDRAELREPNPQPGLIGGVWRLVRDVARHRHVVTNFIQRDIRLKYRDSALGYVWSVLEPLLLSAVYFVLFVIIAGKPQRQYALWVVVGVMTWGFFARSLAASVSCLTANEGLIKQIYLPRALFAVAEVGAQLVMTTLNLLVIIPMMVYYELAPTPYLAMIPAGLLLAGLLALGLGLAFATLNVVLRDVEHIFKFIVRAGLYLSPVMWTIEMIPPSRQGDYVFYNPMAVPITMVRNGVRGEPLGIDPAFVGYSVAMCIGVFLLGVIVFQRFEAAVVKKL